jgi:nucleotide-binding universal stress UspA family protein
MRVLLADDGSPSAGDAVELAAAMSWPPTSELRVVRVDGGRGGGGRSLADAAAALAGPERTVTTEELEGRPASVLRELAGSWDADLVILGTRGFSPIRSLLLGSTSAELAERAPCSVLVVRGAGHRRLVIGTDGSRAATAMPSVLCRWELFRGTTATVLGVAPTADPDDPDEATREFSLATRRLAARLQTCGVDARDEVRIGDPAGVLIEVARSGDADIVALGPHGRSGVRDLVLGSTARNVLQHAGCSVLLVRAS